MRALGSIGLFLLLMGCGGKVVVDPPEEAPPPEEKPSCVTPTSSQWTCPMDHEGPCNDWFCDTYQGGTGMPDGFQYGSNCYANETCEKWGDLYECFAICP
jgi:hypothetical protein